MTSSAYGMGDLTLPELGEVKPILKVKRFVVYRRLLGGKPACACLLMEVMLLGQELPATKQLSNFCATKLACLLIG